MRTVTLLLCYEGGNTHTWESRGLDLNDRGELVNVRRCLRCPVWEEKPYGAGSRRGWRTHRPDGHD